jgi:flagellum-specific ATP synthase
VLSRRVAESGRYPAIDVDASVSRVMHEIVSPEHLRLAQRVRQANSAYESHRDLITIGAYQRGSDPRVDAAIELSPRIENFLRQDMTERFDFNASLDDLAATLDEPPARATRSH